MKTSELYLISEGPCGPIKVGLSTNPRSRLLDLQIGNPRPLRILATYKMEREEVYRAERFLHEELEVMFPRRLVGEWFDISEESILEQMPDFFLSNGIDIILSRVLVGQ